MIIDIYKRHPGVFTEHNNKMNTHVFTTHLQTQNITNIFEATCMLAYVAI